LEEFEEVPGTFLYLHFGLELGWFLGFKENKGGNMDFYESSRRGFKLCWLLL